MDQVELISFNGPIDLLYQLVQSAEMEITTVALASVTGQYLNYVESLSRVAPEDLDPFIELAAKLILIKSLALLPAAESADDSSLTDLKQQLAEYEQIQHSANQLGQLWRGQPQVWLASPQTDFELPRQMPPNLNLKALNQLFEEALARLPSEPAPIQFADTITLEEATHKLRHELGTGRRLNLANYLKSLTSRLDIIMTFLAILELAKIGHISISQPQTFGDMIISNEEP